MVRGDASSPLTVDSDSSHGGDGSTGNKTPPTEVATMRPPTTNIFPNETPVYKFFSNKKQCFWGRVIDYHLDKEYLVRYQDDDATVENVSQAELEYIAKAAEMALRDKKPSSFSTTTHNGKPKKSQLFPNLRQKRKDKDDQQKTSWDVARSDKEVDLYDTTSNDDDHGDDDNDDDKKQDNRKVYATRKRRASTRGIFLLKNARLKQKEFWEASEDDSNDDDDECRQVFGGLPTSKTNHAFATYAAKPIELSEAKKAAELAKIPVESNRALQKILFETGRFRMTLMEHQFLAVREVAGVPKDYPMHEQSVIQSAERANIAESLLNWPVDPNLNKKQRGILIADEMGLGKTIEAIAGMVLRDALVNARGDAGRPSFVVGPNKPVLRQWQDAFLRNGFRPERLHFFRSGQDNVDFRYKKVILFADRYTLQAELKSIFDAISKMEFNSPFPNPKTVLA